MSACKTDSSSNHSLIQSLLLIKQNHTFCVLLKTKVPPSNSRPQIIRMEKIDFVVVHIKCVVLRIVCFEHDHFLLKFKENVSFIEFKEEKISIVVRKSSKFTFLIVCFFENKDELLATWINAISRAK